MMSKTAIAPKIRCSCRGGYAAPLQYVCREQLHYGCGGFGFDEYYIPVLHSHLRIICQSLISEIMSKTEDRPIVINGSIVRVLTVQKEPSIGKIASGDKANTRLISKR